ncbi:CoA transferase [uncultured Jannaschia sp.]|uniref:CoA transferase n=1 Tax=uncultured Jannaschia sp. TaxID=293347 RepID=UPI00260C8390|nr:CoA transferase [uncultured Jannaschia sp.]
MDTNTALLDLLRKLALPDTEHRCRVTIRGHDPVVPSRYRPGLASAVALAAYGAGVAEIWRLRGNGAQSIDVDLAKAAVPGLRTLAYIRRGRHALQLQRPASERQVFFETRDGRQMYLLRHAFYHEHFTRLLSCLDCSPDTASIARTVQKYDAFELEEILAEAKAMGAMARTRDEWLSHPQGRNLAGRTPVEVRRMTESDAEPLTAAARPLEGIRIVDMGHVLAGPMVSRTLAEQGADVIHVSPPHMPDPNHIIADTTFGKRTAFADLRSDVDRDELLALISQADVFVHSWRPGSLEAHGLSFERLSELRPGLIYATVSCYGSDGPWADRAGYDPFGQVVSGLAVGEGSLDEPVLASTFTLNDYLAGYCAAAGVASALIQRAQVGGSYRVDVSLTGTSMWLQDLGQLPLEQWPGAPGGVATLPQIVPDDLQMTQSPLGMIEHPRPIVTFSETPSYWATPPQPAGAGRLAWD